MIKICNIILKKQDVFLVSQFESNLVTFYKGIYIILKFLQEKKRIFQCVSPAGLFVVFDRRTVHCTY